MCKVLIVEGDHKLRSSLANLLDEGGFSVFSCGTIQEAQIVLSKNKIELAIIDVKLPNGEGLKIVEEIYQNIPILIIGKNAPPDIKNEMAVYGVRAFLESPFNEEIFITVVDRIMENTPPDETFVERSERQETNREMGEDVDLERVYAKISTISSRVNRALDDISGVKKELTEQCKDVSKLFDNMALIMEKTSHCDERGVSIALLEQRADFMDRDVKEARAQSRDVANYLKEHPGAIGTILNTGGILLFLIGKSQGWW